MTGAYWPRFRSYDMESQLSLIAALDVTRQPSLGREHRGAVAARRGSCLPLRFMRPAHVSQGGCRGRRSLGCRKPGRRCGGRRSSCGRPRRLRAALGHELLLGLLGGLNGSFVSGPFFVTLFCCLYVRRGARVLGSFPRAKRPRQDRLCGHP